MVEALMPVEDQKIRAALEAVGLADDGNGGVIVMATMGNIVKHYTLATIGDTDPAGYEAIYAASGLFPKGATVRKRDYLQRVVWMPFDCDLIQHQGVDANERDDFRDSLQADIDLMIEGQVAEVEEQFAALGIPIHRIDYTGYGIVAYVYIDERDQHRIDDIREWQRSITAAVNAAAGIELVDKQCTDPGTRVTRIPGSFNNKGSTPRMVRTLRYSPGETVRVADPVAAPDVQPVDVPHDGTGLTAKALTAIENALTPYWTDGQRHAMSVAYAGMLATKRVPESQAIASMERMAAGDKRPSDRMRAVRTSYERVRAGAAVKGYTALKELVPAATLKMVADMLDAFQKAQENRKAAGVGTVRLSSSANGPAPRQRGGETGLESNVDDEWSRMFPLVPDICYYGSFGTYRDIMAPTTEAPDVYHLASALTWFGALVGRNVGAWYASKRIYPNLYTVLIGASGRTRKNTAIERAIYLPMDRMPPAASAKRIPRTEYGINRDVSSAEGFVKDLSQVPWQILYLDEFSIIQKNAQRKGTRTIFDKLIQAYDNPPFLSNRSKNDPNTAKDPFVSLIAATQPRRLSDQMTSEDIHSGFANRLIYVIGAGKDRIARPPDVDAEKAWKLFLDWDDVINSYRGDEKPVLRLARDTEDRWDAWYQQLEQEAKGRSEDEADMIVRLDTHAIKIALIYAISDGDDKIHDRHLEPAIAFVDWMWSVVKELIKGWGIGIEQQIELSIERAFARNGFMSQRMLRDATRNPRRWSDRDFAGVVRAMKENGTLIQDSDSGLLSIAKDEK